MVDPLSLIPLPDEDPGRFFQGPVEPGVVRRRWEAPQQLSFSTRLPARLGDIGQLDDGLWANGGWYPQPVVEGRLPVVEWDVTVTLAPGLVGSLNGVTGRDTLRWSGPADRVALSVIPNGEIIRINEDIILLSRGEKDVRLLRKLLRLAAGWPEELPKHLTVVVDRDRSSLAVAAPGMLFLSEQAFRLSPGLARFHAGAVRTPMLAAAVPLPDGWWRGFCAEALAAAYPAPAVEDVLRWFSWNPVVHAVLYDGTLPFYDDIFASSFGPPTGPQAPTPPPIPPRAAVRQFDAQHGPGAALAVARAVLAGESPPVPPELLASWAAPYPIQDYRVEQRPDGTYLRRDAPPDAPIEVVPLRIDGVDQPPWVVGPGPAERPVSGQLIQLDPQALTSQTERTNDRLPSRYLPVISGYLDDISPSQWSFDAAGWLSLRREGDTRNLYYGEIAHDTEDLVSVELGYIRSAGALIDRLHRAGRWSFNISTSLLDPGFRPTDAGLIAVGTGVGYTRSTLRGELDTAGQLWAVGGSVGFIPGSDQTWAGVGGSAVRYVPLSPHQTFALRLNAAVAQGTVEHRLLSLGGADNLRSVVDHAALGQFRLVSNAEYRWVPFRHLDVPLGLLWLSGFQISPGVEAGALWTDAGPVTAAGATIGAFGLFDLLGASPTFGGLVFGVPVYARGLDPGAWQVYLQGEQNF